MRLFCTADDLIKAFGENEIKKLSGQGKPVADIDMNIVNQAIEAASAEMSMYLTGRNVLDGNTVPASLQRIACDMSRYYLHLNPRDESPVSKQYFKCLLQLKDIAKGILNPGVDDAGDKVEPESTIQFTAGENMFRPKRGSGLW